MAPKFHVEGKTVFITGGSTGLGLEIGKLLAAQGGHVTVFARRQGPLNEAQSIISACRRSDKQDVHAISVDLSNAEQVATTFRAQPRRPDMIFLSAGGTPSQCGLLNDIETEDIDSCIRNNYFTAAYSAHAVLKMWREDDLDEGVAVPAQRHIIFINSAMAFVNFPGMIAYSASKGAVRALADTLRMEALVYSNSSTTYNVHCAFPATFITDSFYTEQIRKPELTKVLEGTTGTEEELARKHPSSKKVAELVLAGVARGDFALCDDSSDSAVSFVNMMGQSPKRGYGIVDTFMGIGMVLGWPFMRRRWESICRNATHDNKGVHLEV